MRNHHFLVHVLELGKVTDYSILKNLLGRLVLFQEVLWQILKGFIFDWVFSFFPADELVGWYIFSSYGAQAMLYIKEEHRRRGFAALLVGWVSRYIVTTFGLIPFVIIVDDNPSSIELFSKIGFQQFGLCQWVFCTPADDHRHVTSVQQGN